MSLRFCSAIQFVVSCMIAGDSKLIIYVKHKYITMIIVLLFIERSKMKTI